MARALWIMLRLGIVLGMPVLLLAATVPAMGRGCRCYHYPRWSYIFVNVEPDGNVLCRSVYSEFDAFGDGRVPEDDPDLAEEIEWRLSEECTFMLFAPFVPAQTGGVFFDWHRTKRVRLPEDTLAAAKADPISMRAALKAFTEAAAPAREDIVGRRAKLGDHELVLAALSSPSGSATQYDVIALVKEIAAWLTCLCIAVGSLWGAMRLRRAATRAVRVERGDCCWSCGYSRNGLTPGVVCPECGNPGSARMPQEDPLVLLGPAGAPSGL